MDQAQTKAQELTEKVTEEASQTDSESTENQQEPVYTAYPDQG